MFELVSNVTASMMQMAPSDTTGYVIGAVGIIIFYAWFIIPFGGFG